MINMFKRNKRVGLALCGGAARGLSHIGVLKVLEGLGVNIDVVSGTSMGAVIGAMYCSGISVDEMQKYVEALDWKSFLLFSDLSFLKTGGMINGRRVEEILNRFLADKNFEDCERKFNCTAVDIISRQEVIIDSGPLKDAVRASISIPGFFSPVCLDDKVLVDGGIIEPLPAKAIRKLKPDIVIASSITFKNQQKIDALCKFEKETEKAGADSERSRKQQKRRVSKIPLNTILDVSMSIMQRTMTEPYLDYADIIIDSEVGDFGFMDFTKGKQIIARGIEAAEKKSKEVAKKLKIKK